MLVERSIDADTVVATLERLVAERGAPEFLTVRQRPGDDRQRAPRLVPCFEDRDRVHRARLAVAEGVGLIVHLLSRLGRVLVCRAASRGI